jgi:Tol biopolymer transport system component
MVFLFLTLFLLAGFSAAKISAESGKIAYASGNAIYKMNANGTSVQQLTFNDSNQRDFSPVWSPNGTKIAFVRLTASQEESTSGGGNEGGVGGWEWIPSDPVYITVYTYSLYTMDYNGANLTLIRNSPTFINDLTWSPDGTKLAYVQGGDTTYMGVFQTCGGGTYIYIVDAVAGGAASHVSETVNGIDPSWSPDGAEIFYAVNNSPENYGIYSLNLSDNSVHRWTYDGAAPADPEISPDGTKIVYATGYAEAECLFGNMSTMGPTRMYTYRGSLILYNITQNSYTMLTSGASSPTWQPGGNLILYVNSSGSGSEADVGQELTTITATGQNQTLIQNWQSGETSGSWSP